MTVRTEVLYRDNEMLTGGRHEVLESLIRTVAAVCRGDRTVRKLYIGKGSGRTAAIVGGVAAGAVLGGYVGNSMEASDEARVQHTLETGRTGKTVIWQNPDTGNRYEVTPTRTYRTADNRDCREYKTWVFVDGYEEQVTGTACRLPNGTWQRQAG